MSFSKGLSATKRNHQSGCQANQMTVVKLSSCHHSNHPHFPSCETTSLALPMDNPSVWLLGFPLGVLTHVKRVSVRNPVDRILTDTILASSGVGLEGVPESRPPLPRPPPRPPSNLPPPLPLPPEKPPLPESGPLEVLRSTFNHPPAASLWSASADAFCRRTR